MTSSNIKIFATTEFVQDFKSNNWNLSIFQQEFAKWKHYGENSSYTFAHDKGDPPRYLRHAHLAPEGEGERLLEWKIHWDNPKWRHLRKSDRGIFYAHARQQEYILIGLLEDPGAHEIWKKHGRPLRLKWEDHAEQFCVFNKIV